MVNRIMILLLLVICCLLAIGQHSFVNLYVEKTSVSPKAGTQIGYEFPNRFELGGFYQREVTMPGIQETTRPRFYEQEFFGIFIAGPIISQPKFDMKLGTRMGITNQENFTITPSLLGNYRLFDFLQIQGGVGIRAFRLTYQAGIRVNLF